MLGKYELNNIYNEDSYQAIKDIPDDYFDLLITDPPYGLNIDGQKKQECKNPKHNRKFHKKEDWDSKIPNEEFFKEMIRISKNQIIFGANYFNEYLPQGKKGWIIWDKGQRGLTMSDCEIIYTSFQVATRILTVNRVELQRDRTFHPTQKPLKLMLEIVKKYTKDTDKIIDCFAGSGTTLEACQLLERDFLGFELNENYYKKTVDRLNGIRANGQISIFTDIGE